MTSRRKFATWLRKAALVAGLFVLLPLGALADKVVLKNGRVVEGRIVSTEGSEIAIDVGGIRQRFAKDQVESYDQDSVESFGPGEADARAAFEAIEADDSLVAWRHLLQMHKSEPEAWRRHITTIQRTIKGLNDAAAKAVNAGEPLELLALVDLFGNDASAQLVANVYPEAVNDYKNQMRVFRGDGHRLLGEQARRTKDLQTAERELNEALKFLVAGDRGYSQAAFSLGGTLVDKGMAFLEAKNDVDAEKAFRDAIVFYDMARQYASEATTAEIAQREISKIRDQYIARIYAGRPTPTPPPTPTPLPTPTPIPPSPTPDPGLVKGLLGEGISAKIDAALNKVLPAGMDSGQVLDWIGYAIIFIIGFWVIPSAILRFLVKRADIVADQWLPKVKFLGPIALIGYMAGYLKSNVKTKAVISNKPQCPHCGFILDDYYSYKDLDFSHCPNCGGEVNPVHTIVDYIQFLGNSLATDAERVAMGAVSMSNFVEKDTMQRLVRGLITYAVRRRASDLHIEPQQGGVVIRFRVDGMMMEITRLGSSLGPPLVSAIKVQANLDISEKRKPQDGAMQIFVDERNIDIRVASSPSQAGETVTLRLLDSRTIMMDIKNLGMTKSGRALFEKAISEPHGLLLVTGPTGSGKTTTLYVALQAIKTGEKNIISVEDPIEFRIPGINQIQVNPTAGLTFANGLRSILRQDPDVIMVGEIRDNETAEIAVNAAQTGHLVFSTLHTIDAAASVSRLIDLGITPRQFSEALSLVVAQRLVRLICPDCKKEAKPKPQILREIGITEGAEADYPFAMGKGCDLCNQTGYFGRAGVFEMLVPTEKLRNAMERQNLTTVEIRELAVQGGMRTLREESLVLLKQGMSTAEEVLRVTK